ncbi:MAG TPA: PAS domain S-box protein [Methanothermobacter sp.]|nr:PAS domain S-box protein [Methanothermobacter sp.]
MADIKIILVEDENIDAMDIKETLESFNYEVPYVASTGIDAIKHILEIMPDLILIDIVLKGDMDGIELAYKIKELGIPFIYLTAHAEEDLVKKAMKTDPYGYIIKPFDKNKLRFSIEHAIYKKEMELETNKQISITRAINKILKNALLCTSPDDVAKICLEVAEELTDSKFGLIGKINPAGRHDTIAISDPGWAECVMPKTKAVKNIVNLKIRGYLSRTLTTGKPVIVNDPNSDPERIGEPEGHPEIKSFMAIPLKQGDETVGMIALANKKSGYNKDDKYAIEMLSVAFMGAINSKNTEITLKKSEERFRAVAESAVDAIVTTDVNGIIRYFNQSLEDIFGYSERELTGKPLTTLMPERFRKNYTNELERFKKYAEHRLIGKTVSTIGLKKDGVEFPFEMSLSSWKSGDHTFFTAIIRDITEKKEAEEKLRQSEDRLKMAMEIANLVYWEYDFGDDLFLLNDQFYTLYGTTAKDEGGYLMSPSEYANRFLPPEEHEVVGMEIARVNESNDPNYSSTVRHSIIRCDGEKRHIIVRIRARFDENGNKIGAKGVNQDETELKLAEDALAESHRRMADIIDFLPDATFVIDTEGKVIAWNKAIEEMTGVASEEIMEKGNYEYAIPFYGKRRPILLDMFKESYEKVQKQYRISHRKGEILTVETDLILKGEKRTVWAKAAPLYDPEGNWTGNIEVIRDITKMKESQNQIKRELDINKSLANIYAPLVAPKSTIYEVGQVIIQEAQKLTGSKYGFAAALDSSLQVIDNTVAMGVADDYEGNMRVEFPINSEGKYYGLLMNALKNKQSFLDNSPQKNIDFAYIPPGDPELENMLVVPVLLAEKLVGVITLTNTADIFTRDDLDAIERLAVFYAMAIQNKKAEKKIKQSLHEKKILLREIHHRVKNNMQIISSLLNLQLNYVTEEKSANLLKESRGRIKSMAMVHEKLYQSPSLTKIDLGDYVGALVSNIFFTYGINTKNIKKEIDVENIEIGIDTAIPCGLIINEIVTNSVKHAFPDHTGKITVKISSSHDDIQLTLSDNGIGIPEKLDYEKTDSLGLKLVKSLVDQIDGHMTIESTNGTSIKIIFKEVKYKKRI